MPDTIQIKFSAKMARLPFHGCEPEYIRTVCRARCCESSTAPQGVLITIGKSEEQRIRDLGGVIKDGFLQPRPGGRRCPFKTENQLCALHSSGGKPHGCIASPFMLNGNGTLIVRNRYRLLKCFKAGDPPMPAYKAFRASLDLLFGSKEAKRISTHLDSGGGDLAAFMLRPIYREMREREQLHRGAR